MAFQFPLDFHRPLHEVQTTQSMQGGGSPCCPLFPIQYEMQLLCLTFRSQSATLNHFTHLILYPSNEIPWNAGREIGWRARERDRDR